LIQAHNLSYRTATGYAVKDMSFTLSAGGIHGILGHKGAGKTTLLHLLSGVLSATDGSLTVSGHDMSKDARAVQARIGYLPSAEPLYNSMTVSEYLDFIGEAKRVAPDKRFRQIKSALELTELSDEADKLLARCSLSVRRRVGVAQALLGNPDLILMDEPLRGLPPSDAKLLCELLEKLGSVKTLVVSSASLSDLAPLSRDILLLDGGTVLAHGSLSQLEARLSNTPTLALRVRADERALVDSLGRIDDVLSYTVTAYDKGIVSLTLEYEPSSALPSTIAESLSALGYTVLSVRSETLTLASVYASMKPAEPVKDKKAAPTSGKSKRGGGKR